MACRAKALGVLLLAKAEPPDDHQRDRQQCQDRCHQASDGGHGSVVNGVVPALSLRLTPSLYRSVYGLTTIRLRIDWSG